MIDCSKCRNIVNCTHNPSWLKLKCKHFEEQTLQDIEDLINRKWLDLEDNPSKR